jgi:hypothetical protein
MVSMSASCLGTDDQGRGGVLPDGRLAPLWHQAATRHALVAETSSHLAHLVGRLAADRDCIALAVYRAVLSESANVMLQPHGHAPSRLGIPVLGRNTTALGYGRSSLLAEGQEKRSSASRSTSWPKRSLQACRRI